jgi:hypothetical protein
VATLVRTHLPNPNLKKSNIFGLEARISIIQLFVNEKFSIKNYQVFISQAGQ